MRKVYTLSAITAEGQDTSIRVAIDDDAKLREWLFGLRRGRVVVQNFRFRWTSQLYTTVFPLRGSFWAECKWDGIYVVVNLGLEHCYINVEYPLYEFCSMIKCARPALGWCITVKV